MKNRHLQWLVDLIVLVSFGIIMFISKMIMEFLPNVHAIAMFIAVFTLSYRHKALISIYVYAFLSGFTFGFSTWWYPYLYIWTVLWALIMLIPKNASIKCKGILATVFCALHGISYGVLYAPFQALAFGLSFEGMISWIAVGFPWDIVHMLGNIAMSVLIIPLYKTIVKLQATSSKNAKKPVITRSSGKLCLVKKYKSGNHKYFIVSTKNSTQK